jgi:hypothetical protein
MTVTRLIVVAVALILGAGEVAACSREHKSARQGATSATVDPDDGPGRSCLPAAEVTRVVGFPVQILVDTSDGGNVACAYQATDPGEEGTLVSIGVGPAEQADEVFEEVRSGAKVAHGQRAEAERINVGDRGYAYGSSSGSQAAAVARGRVYQVSIQLSMQSATPDTWDKKAAAIQLLQKLIR